MNPPHHPDAKVLFHLTDKTIDGQPRRVLSGYRPIYDVRPDYWTSTHHEFLDPAGVVTDGEVEANVWFISPEAYPKTLWVGRVLSVAEGSRIVASAKVLEVFNPLLKRD
jgi:hypothetical protein